MSVSVGVTVATGVGVGVSVDAGAGVGVGVDEPLNVILGLLVYLSVTGNPLVVSWTFRVTVPFIWDEIVKLASPFCVVTFCGRLPPFIWVSEFPELTEMFNVSDTGAGC